MKHTYLRLVLLLAVLTGCRYSASASETISEICSPQKEGIVVSLEDMLTKVYGIIPAEYSEETMSEEAGSMGLNPSEDEGGLWLDSSDGYRISYSGMTPEVSARAEYRDGKLEGFTYYFLFPFECERTRSLANLDQCRFCGSMLQEMTDMGMEMGADAGSEALVDAIGSYGNSQVEVTLLEDSDRYTLILSITPDSFTPADNLLASAN